MIMMIIMRIQKRERKRDCISISSQSHTSYFFSITSNPIETLPEIDR